ncbi:MAG TPA: hypothetical protein VJG66_00895 [Patescibacteria group bacterium]|nr:hypothetical protein [Patescibacteria group bacterium]
MKNTDKYLYFIFAVVGWIFLKSGFEKISAGKFVGALGATLTKFAKDNPYPPVKAFLENVAVPNSAVFGFLTQWGEFLAGINLLLLSLWMIFNPKSGQRYSKLMALGFGTGLLLNITFWLAAGYTSPSTGGLNLVMGAINLTGLIFILRESKAK